jgi:alpha-L-fucosidase
VLNFLSVAPCILDTNTPQNGAIQEEHQASLSAMGAWMKQFGATIYGTQKGPLKPTDDFAITRKGNVLYLHVLNPQLEKIHFADFDGKIASIKAFEGGAALPYKNDRFGLVIDLAKAPAHEIDRIVEIRLKS